MAAKVTEKPRCVIIAGAPDPDIDLIRRTIHAEDHVICADAGYAAAKQAGVAPDLLVGDFDSYTGALPDNCELLSLCPEKDDTDTQHCVTVALERGYRDFVLLAATGGRLDHTLANLSILRFLAENGASGVILSATETITLLTRGEHRCDGLCGKTFSVLPFGCDSVNLSYSGAKYPLSQGTLRHSVAVGISNIFTADEAVITVHSGRALLLVVND